MPAFSEFGQQLVTFASECRHVPSIVSVIGKAFSVTSGIVFTVKGAARALIYSISEALGSLVPVLAQRRRWGRAPALKMRCQRGESIRSRYLS